MGGTGIRELKNGLSQFVRRAAGGERIAVTAHGRVVAVLSPPDTGTSQAPRLAALVQKGAARAPVEPGDPLADLPGFKLPKGTAARLLDEDRDGT